MTDSSYYNTTHVRGQKLRIYEFAAERQEDAVLEFFQANPTAKLSAEDVGRLVLPRAPRTSWGRCLTNLKKAGKIIKTDETVEGAWKREIYLWQLAPDPRRPVQGELLESLVPIPAFVR